MIQPCSPAASTGDGLPAAMATRRSIRSAAPAASPLSARPMTAATDHPDRRLPLRHRARSCRAAARLSPGRGRTGGASRRSRPEDAPTRRSTAQRLIARAEALIRAPRARRPTGRRSRRRRRALVTSLAMVLPVRAEREAGAARGHRPRPTAAAADRPPRNGRARPRLGHAADQAH